MLQKLILLAIVAATGCGRGYSEGQRSGTVVKFSKKGVFYKSYEGTMNLGGISRDADGNVVPATWDFSVMEAGLVQPILAYQDSSRHVTLIYVQWLQAPLSVNSDYEVVGIK